MNTQDILNDGNVYTTAESLPSTPSTADQYIQSTFTTTTAPPNNHLLQFNVPDSRSNPLQSLLPYLTHEPTVFIMRGLPGSGKSSLAQSIKTYYHTTYQHHNNNTGNVSICSADNYFINSATNEYVFNIDKLPAAHLYCMQCYINSIESRVPIMY